MWDIRDSILVNVGNYSKRTSSFSQLGTSTWAVGGVCTLGVESSLDMVVIFSNPWKRMLTTSYALGMSKNKGIDINRGMEANLKDEPFLSPVLCFFVKDLTSMVSFTLFCCHLRNPDCKLAVISSSPTSSMIDGTTSSMVSHYSVCSTSNVSFGSVTVSWAWSWMVVFFFVGWGVGLEVAQEVEPKAYRRVPSWCFFFQAFRRACLASTSTRQVPL